MMDFNDIDKNSYPDDLRYTDDNWQGAVALIEAHQAKKQRRKWFLFSFVIAAFAVASVLAYPHFNSNELNQITETGTTKPTAPNVLTPVESDTSKSGITKKIDASDKGESETTRDISNVQSQKIYPSRSGKEDQDNLQAQDDLPTPSAAQGNEKGKVEEEEEEEEEEDNVDNVRNSAKPNRNAIASSDHLNNVDDSIQSELSKSQSEENDKKSANQSTTKPEEERNNHSDKINLEIERVTLDSANPLDSKLISESQLDIDNTALNLDDKDLSLSSDSTHVDSKNTDNPYPDSTKDEWILTKVPAHQKQQTTKDRNATSTVDSEDSNNEAEHTKNEDNEATSIAANSITPEVETDSLVRPTFLKDSTTFLIASDIISLRLLANPWVGFGKVDNWSNINIGIGAEYERNFTEKIGLSIGLDYLPIQGLPQVLEQSSTSYDLGFDSTITALRTDKLHILSAPLQFSYRAAPRLQLSFVSSISYLLWAENTLDKRRVTNFSTEALGSESGEGYLQGFNRLHLSSGIGLEYWMNQNFSIGSNYYYGLSDISKDDQFHTNNKDLNSRLAFFLKYRLK